MTPSPVLPALAIPLAKEQALAKGQVARDHRATGDTPIGSRLPVAGSNSVGTRVPSITSGHSRTRTRVGNADHRSGAGEAAGGKKHH